MTDVYPLCIFLNHDFDSQFSLPLLSSKTHRGRHFQARLVICRLRVFWSSLQIPRVWGPGFLALCNLLISLYKVEKQQIERGGGFLFVSVLCQPTLLLEVSLISRIISEPMLRMTGSISLGFSMVLLWLTIVG